jgi:hypothetical protein
MAHWCYFYYYHSQALHVSPRNNLMTMTDANSELTNCHNFLFWIPWILKMLRQNSSETIGNHPCSIVHSSKNTNSYNVDYTLNSLLSRPLIFGHLSQPGTLLGESRKFLVTNFNVISIMNTCICSIRKNGRGLCWLWPQNSRLFLHRGKAHCNESWLKRFKWWNLQSATFGEIMKW